MNPWDDTARFLLALTMWREARGEPDPALSMRAVGCVIRNRAHDGDWIRVITAHNQFSSISVLGDSQTVIWPKAPSITWERAWELSGAIMGQSDAGGDPVDDPTGGATFYRNPATATSAWFDQAVASGKLQETVTIAHHVFYKEA